MKSGLWNNFAGGQHEFFPKREELGMFIEASLESCSNWKNVLCISDKEKAENDGIDAVLECLEKKVTNIPTGSSNSGSKILTTLDYEKELGDAFDLLFGSPCRLTLQELLKWFQTYFEFANETLPEFPIGLVQKHSGPCGTLVPIQCWMICYKMLCFFKRETNNTFSFKNNKETAKSSPPSSTANDTENKQHLTTTSSSIRSQHQGPSNEKTLNTGGKSVPSIIFSSSDFSNVKALAWAITICLYRCTVQSQYFTVFFKQVPMLSRIPKNGIDFFSLNHQLQVKKHNSIIEVYDDVLIMLESKNPFYLVGFIFSLILTRGCPKIKNDMDDVTFSLIGLHGHSSQELVNLLVTGEAVSNTFDGTFNFSGSDTPGSILKGIQRQQIIGYLTQLEAAGYCAVGQYYKSPILPIWVIGSSTHFTALASVDPRICVVSRVDHEVDSLTRKFNEFDPEMIGVIQAALLPELLKSCGLFELYADARRVLDPPGQGCVIVKCEFLEWAASSLMLNTSAQQTGIVPPKRFILYHYDGQVPPNPQLTVLLVEPIDVTGVIGDDDTGDLGLGTIFRTKWNNAAIKII